ncbi:hypothetical protein NHH03_06875 [Stieleria sp. TO1_6]|uniref:hypothetical protein n=1 Tax=Stieleria tagensis TaxID=2956795 RepID=UPI00209B733E|nr:hypothetical protein [Stieleria tagensis]MCO8121454.1 hypothetical protein [Stieleria tagensis]
MKRAKAATLQNGEVGNGRKVGGQNCPPTSESAAGLLNVSPKSVKNAKSAIKNGCDQLGEAMDRDEVSADLAAKFVKAVPDKRKQKGILKDGVDAAEVSENVRHGAQIPNARAAREVAKAPHEKQSGFWDTTR